MSTEEAGEGLLFSPLQFFPQYNTTTYKGKNIYYSSFGIKEKSFVQNSVELATFSHFYRIVWRTRFWKYFIRPSLTCFFVIKTSLVKFLDLSSFSGCWNQNHFFWLEKIVYVFAKIWLEGFFAQFVPGNYLWF